VSSCGPPVYRAESSGVLRLPEPKQDGPGLLIRCLGRDKAHLGLTCSGEDGNHPVLFDPYTGFGVRTALYEAAKFS